MTVVAIHQPNYLPWLGYFWKMARADVFVFLDDVQYSKNGYINRVRILDGEASRWLTVPVSFRLGDTISAVYPAQSDWSPRHCDTLRQRYRRAAAFSEIWPDIENLYRDAPDADLATINRFFIERLAVMLGLTCRCLTSSSLDTSGAVGDDRLIRIVQAIEPGAMYLSGRGGANYQDPGKFRDAGSRLVYTDFAHPEYSQGIDTFYSGLSVVDALFHCGLARVSDWLAEARPGVGTIG
ncbi:MAG: WbqC family protein [Rhodospirillales bacterium]|nr:WbqC family protein [Rhodospirillales bacterium]